VAKERERQGNQATDHIVTERVFFTRKAEEIQEKENANISIFASIKKGGKERGQGKGLIIIGDGSRFEGSNETEYRGSKEKKKTTYSLLRREKGGEKALV